jgi:hypothetical protein
MSEGKWHVRPSQDFDNARGTASLTDFHIYGNMVSVKTTIDIPETLYRQAKIHAIEQGASLKEILLRGLQRELEAEAPLATPNPKSFHERRKLRPGFQRLLESGGLSGGTDSTAIISEDRSSRDDALL